MYTLFQQPEEARKLHSKCKALVAEILAQVPATREALKIDAQQELFREPSQRGHLYFLREGTLSYARGDRVLFCFEEGDLIGLESCFGTSTPKIRSEFAVIVDEYSTEDFLTHVNAHADALRLWHEFLVGQISMFTTMCGALVKDQINTTPDVKQYRSGDVIIQQGARDTDVYTLLDGQADVFLDDVKVGEIEADEIFGAIAALKERPRTATVVAACDCSVLVFPKNRFEELIEARPAAIRNMVEAMASKIVSLNERVVGLLHGAE